MQAMFKNLAMNHDRSQGVIARHDAVRVVKNKIG